MMKIQGLVLVFLAMLVFLWGPHDGLPALLAVLAGLTGLWFFFEGLKREAIVDIRQSIQSGKSGKSEGGKDVLCRLTRAPNDPDASLIVNMLADRGIKATAVGGFTAGFRADAPGDVQVLVRQGDLERARYALDNFRANDEPVDWKSVDVGQPEE